jgi:pimeloyl-ACP methyl ester carboxylesterase
MPTAEFGGILTHWRDWGSGPGRALMIHCSLAHSGAWTGVAEALSDLRNLTAFDLPGPGRSGAWDDPTRDIMDQTMDMALGLIDGTPVDLIGHSFGAVACLRLAVERPDLVRSLSLYEPVFFAAARALGHDTDLLFRDFAIAIATGDRDEAARLFTGLWGAGDSWDSLPAGQRDALSARIHLVPAGSPTLHDDRSSLLVPGRLEAVVRPTLLIEGALSPPGYWIARHHAQCAAASDFAGADGRQWADALRSRNDQSRFRARPLERCRYRCRGADQCDP